MNIGEVQQQWAYTDQQQTGMALSQFRTKPQTYTSHQSMVTPQPTNTQIPYLGHTYHSSSMSVQPRGFSTFYPQGVLLEQVNHTSQPHHDVNGYDII